MTLKLMLTIITNGESRRFGSLSFFILMSLRISRTSSLLKIMIFIYMCQEKFRKSAKKVWILQDSEQPNDFGCANGGFAVLRFLLKLLPLCPAPVFVKM